MKHGTGEATFARD